MDEDKILGILFAKLEHSNPKFYNMAIFDFFSKKFRLDEYYNMEQLIAFRDYDYHASNFRTILFDLLKYEAILAYKNKIKEIRKKVNLNEIQEEISIIKNKNVLYSHTKILIKGS